MKKYPDEPFELYKGAGAFIRACYPAHLSKIATPPYKVQTVRRFDLFNTRVRTSVKVRVRRTGSTSSTHAYLQGHFSNHFGVCGHLAISETIMGNKTLIEELKSEEFDLVIVDLIGNHASLSVAKQLNIPIISFYIFSFTGRMATFASSPFNLPSYVPTYESGFASRMTFVERVRNFIYYLSDWQQVNLISRRVLSSFCLR